MKRKFKITFEGSLDYVGLKETKLLSKDFVRWLKSFTSSSVTRLFGLVPPLYERHKNGSIEYEPNGKVHIKIEVDKEVVLDTSCDYLSKDF